MSALPSMGSLKTETGLSELNKWLAERSFVEGGKEATAADFARLAQIHVIPDRENQPHLLRWYKHLLVLRQRYPLRYDAEGNRVNAAGSASASNDAAGGAAAKKGRAAGKEKKELTIDCQSTPCADRTKPSADFVVQGRAGSSNFPVDKKSGTYYITTAINYANGYPHIGHAYEAFVADVFARHHRLMGKDTFFMTGSDEHGQKIAQAAEDAGMTPIALCDKFVDGFKALNQRLNISEDMYVRTTADYHKAFARELWNKCKAKGDIYLDRYEGWYLTREERYVTETEAQESNYKDPMNPTVPLKKVSEPSFFFRLGKYAPLVQKYIEDNPSFIRPQQYHGEILERLRGMEAAADFRDLCVSRGSFAWGVPCPEEKVDGQSHVMYVWFDALSNYISGLQAKRDNYWPAQMHIIGKDITWFHTVIWPAMLMSAELPLPKSVAVHGFIAGPDGRKMSKSFGNVINPHDMLDKYPVDTFRWFMIRAASYGDELKFSEEALKLQHNSDLCDNLGNLVNRAVNLCGGSVPECNFKLVKQMPFSVTELRTATSEAFLAFKTSEAAELVIRACSATNKWIADLAPWKMKGDDEQALRTACFRVLLEAIYVLAHFFAPFIPAAADAIFKKMNSPPRPIPKLADNFQNLKAGTEVTTGSILFQQLEVTTDQPASSSADAKTKDAAPKAKAQGKAKAKEPEEVEDPNQPLFSKLEVRVGKVVEAWNHPDAEKLYCEKIDVGEAEPRQIVSGLRDHYPIDKFQGRKLLAVCNMQPKKLRGVTSHGMVLCAKNPEKGVVELLEVPDSCKVGERVLPQGVPETWKAVGPKTLQKNTIWESIAKELRTNGDRVACFGGVPLGSAGAKQYLAPTLPNAEIS